MVWIVVASRGRCGVLDVNLTCRASNIIIIS